LYDHSPRLWINHRYASEVDSGRRQLTHLAVCYNNQCLKEPGRLEQLEQIVFGMGGHLKAKPAHIRPATSVFEPTAMSPPGEIVLLRDLPKNHEARAYVESRGFDPDLLSDNFQIGLCATANEPRFEVMRNRLYIPVTFRQSLVGWQCRTLGGAMPKYLNAPNMRKSAYLYNFDSAASQPFVVVVEGVPSVWRLGCAAVCLFGKSMSMAQQSLISRTWAGKPVFLLLDNDAKAEMDQAKMALTQSGMKVVTIELPDARDPADYSLDAIMDLLMDRAEAAGVINAMI